jgi:SAM-dependent methyltransferase
MSLFGGQYAANYDLFYAKKDYPAEAAFVKDVLHRHNPSANSMVEFGCGSARHAVEFVRAGFRVTGIDRSAEMIALGQERRKTLPPRLQEHLNLMQGDAVGFRPTLNADAVVSLFHVVNYQTSNEALLGIFDSARTTLIPGGLFVFDFWYGPAVLAERPQVRVKRVTTSSHNLMRIAEPEHQINRNVVDVRYTLISVDRETGLAEQHVETHAVRYLFLPEIELLAAHSGFEIVEAGEWLTGKTLHERCWSGYAAARRASKTESKLDFAKH